MALMIEYRITLLITRADGAEEIRTVHQEGWSASDAIHKAERRARDDDDEVEEARSVGVS